MNLNLARKWRSKQFDEIVGQPLAVRLVKNSLYRNLLFPVYLLSGTRGTGKTSTGRIFAAALNCEKLSAFQQDPRTTQVPCLSCASCTAMLQMNHPDFIEIDAASHTGVDNVRTIIDAASFVPVLGKKKIYLIDEAHMLSKAAFNAFLKILEEPPPTAVFMLATTDPHKIIPTVLSRCFQVFFDPIKPMEVVTHLQYICEQEGLVAEPNALLLIAQETEGSMRDALNMLERLRALPEVMNSAGEPSVITKKAVVHLLGSIDEDRLIELLSAVIEQNPSKVLATIDRVELSRYTPSIMWKKLVETLRKTLWLKQGVTPDEAPVSSEVQEFVKRASYQQLIYLLDLCYTYELSFAKTSVPHTMLEVLLLKMAEGDEQSRTASPSVVKRVSNKTSQSPAIPPKEPTTPKQKAAAPITTPSSPMVEADAQSSSSLPPVEKHAPMPQQHETVTHSPQAKSMSTEATHVSQEPRERATGQQAEQISGPWGACLADIEGISDPLVVSIFKQAIQVKVHEGTLQMTFAEDLQFFGDWLATTTTIWQPIIDKYFGTGTVVKPQFTGASTKKKPLVAAPIKPMPAVVPEEKPQPSRPPNRSYQKRGVAAQQPAGKPVSTEEVEQSQTGSLLMKSFSGTLRVEPLAKETT